MRKGRNAKQAFIESAIRIVAREGLDKATTKAIAADAGLNEAYIYRCFESKEAMLRDAFHMEDVNFAYFLKQQFPAMHDEDTPWKSRAFRLWSVSWRFILERCDDYCFYLRYYYSANCRKYAYKEHLECFQELFAVMRQVFRPEANVDMLPICRTVQGEFEKNGYLVRQLAKRLQVQPGDVLSFELCAYCCAEPTLLGFEQDILSSPRLDNLSSVHACLQGLADAQGDGINVAVLYDNEEIGSNTRRGADSSTLTVILEKLALSLGLDRTALLDACLNGMLLSCDAAHAMHPNHPEYADFSCAPVLGGGVALKRSPRYSSDAETCAVIQGLCDANQIPLQIYMNRADLPGGSTVGSMASSLLAMPAADIGVPILAMHSACETMGAADQDAFVRLCTAFFQA